METQDSNTKAAFRRSAPGPVWYRCAAAGAWGPGHTQRVVCARGHSGISCGTAQLRRCAVVWHQQHGSDFGDGGARTARMAGYVL